MKVRFNGKNIICYAVFKHEVMEDKAYLIDRKHTGRIGTASSFRHMKNTGYKPIYVKEGIIGPDNTYVGDTKLWVSDATEIKINNNREAARLLLK